MTTPISLRQSLQDRADRRRGVRHQALQVVLRCFANAVGATSGAIIWRADDQPTRLLADWADEENSVSLSWTSGTLLGRMLSPPTPPGWSRRRVSPRASPCGPRSPRRSETRPAATARFTEAFSPPVAVPPPAPGSDRQGSPATSLTCA